MCKCAPLNIQVWCITTLCQGSGEMIGVGDSVSVYSWSHRGDMTCRNHGIDNWKSFPYSQNGFQNGNNTPNATHNEMRHIISYATSDMYSAL